eukprot:CAMPEP_0178408086 /NCGR_PEP_ID=MMETSP0689_2-20121128/19759_1 /TAXON_ID=160604 /ORGANISM="Amphidinium massartii, Strain CS-259" /LENGTH=707 /DNA_ID=CAMNT_0020029173 /DNA_START=76 /DNA_END=2196 /DNA_ORIENTATION=+
MKMAPKAVLAFAIVTSCTLPVQSMDVAANPIRRVVSMLQAMATKIEEEGKKGEELYEKFQCFCKTSGAGLQGSIAEGEAKVPQLEASLDETRSKKAQLEADLKEHKATRDAAKKSIEEATAIREKEAAEFAEESSEYNVNTDALDKAIAAVSNGMAGSFIQTPAAQVLQRFLASSPKIGGYDRDTVTSFLSAGEGYAPASGEITGILKQMKDDMMGDLADITKQEEEAKAAFAELMAAKEKEIAAATKAIEDKTKRVGDLGVEIVNIGNDIDDTSEALAENQKFLADLGKNCDTKKAEWEEATKTRTEELLAISETIKILNDDDALELFKKTLPSPSLIQTVSDTQAQRSKAAALLQSLSLRAQKGSKPALDLITMALSGKKVSFEKVFKLIDELVAVLEQEQEDDTHKKEYCEGQFDTTEDKVKAVEQNLKDLDASIEDTKEMMSTLTAELKALADGIAALDKSVAESTQTRKEEHEEYSELISSDSAAKELLGVAKNRLNKFYNPKLFKAPPKRVLSKEETIYSNFGGELAPTPAPGGIANTGVMALVQLHSQSGSRQPTPPETFEPYAKKGEESNGVIKMIDMLIADLTKEMTEAEAEEKNAQAAYEKFMEDAAEKRATDSKAITDKEAAKATAEGDLAKLKDDDSAKKKELMATEEYMSSLHGECDWLLKNFDLRKTARAGEIESLKSAKAVLAGADYSFVQQ